MNIKNFLLIACAMSGLCACQRESKDDKILNQTRKYTESSCPKRMDEYTVLDSMVYCKQTRTMAYYYSVSGNMDTDSAYTTVLSDLLGSSLLDNIRGNAGLSELKDHGVTFKYIYSSQSKGSVYITFTYSPDIYK